LRLFRIHFEELDGKYWLSFYRLEIARKLFIWSAPPPHLRFSKENTVIRLLSEYEVLNFCLQLKYIKQFLISIQAPCFRTFLSAYFLYRIIALNNVTFLSFLPFSLYVCIYYPTGCSLFDFLSFLSWVVINGSQSYNIDYYFLFFAGKECQMLMHHFDKLCLVCWREKGRNAKKVTLFRAMYPSIHPSIHAYIHTNHLNISKYWFSFLLPIWVFHPNF
jgi:hypothetical protein